MAICGGPSTAVNIVESRFNSWNLFATEAFNNAANYVEQIAEFNIEFNEITSGFDVSGSIGSPFSYQPPPTAPNTAIDYSQFNEPSYPSLPIISPPSFGNVPTNTASKPALVFPNAPVLTDPTDPGDAPVISDVTLPTAPDVDDLLPTAPTLADISLPTAPTISLPTFTATAPTDVPVAPGDTFSFTDETYSSTLFDNMVTKVGEWIDGAALIPDAIWNSMWDRARANEIKIANRAREEVTNRWAGKSFSSPPGRLNADLQEINQDLLNKESEINREITIKQAEFLRDDIKFAVQEGIALEKITTVLFNDRMARALDAAKYAFEATINIFNAKVTLYNTQYQAFKTEADVYKTQIESELAKLDVYKAELEGQSLLNDVNKTDIDLYNARLNSVLTHIEVYKGELDGVLAQVNIDKARVDAFIGEVQAFTALHNANATQVSSYAEQIKAENSKADLYRIEVDAFAADVRAYSASVDAQGTSKEIEINWQNSQLAAYNAQLEAYKVQIEAEIERVKSEVDIYDGLARIYATEIGQEEARVRANSSQYELAIEEGKADAQLKLEAGRFNLENYLNTLKLELAQLDTIAKVQSNLASSALAALDVRASISSQANDNFNYDCG